MSWIGTPMASTMPRQRIQDFLHQRDLLTRRDAAQAFGVHTTRYYSTLVDHMVVDLLRDTGLSTPGTAESQAAFAVAGTGSYGRQELCFGSDVDLMIIHRNGLSETTRKSIAQALYPLWDARLDLSYTFLTAEECLDLMREELSVLTATLDLRFIYGSRPVFREFLKILQENVEKERKRFLDQLLLYQEKRESKYGRVDFFLEPEIKQGLGGLRDLHVMAWIARLFLGVTRLGRIKQNPDFSHFNLSQLMYSKRFLLKIRNHLHLLSGRREDRLLIPHQRDIAQILEYRDRPYSTGPERFMRNLYLHLNRIRYGREEFLTKALDILLPLPPDPAPARVSEGFSIHHGHLVLDGESLLDKSPLVILQAFNEANHLGISLGSGFIWEARKKLLFEGKRLVEAPKACELFLRLILHPKNPKTIRLALEIGLIDLFIPEFRRIRNLAQFGYYHVETVDLHALSTLDVLYSMGKGAYDDRFPLFKEVYDGLQSRDWLYLAALIHDIGKGYRGDHSKKGAQVVPRILGRLGIEDEGIRTVSFLVENHLLLVNTSQKRDLNDEKTAVQVAQAIQRSELLDLLFLLTVADCFATGPTASSDWKMMLLMELFTKAKHILDLGRLASADATTRLRQKKRVLQRKLVREFPKKDLLSLMDQASTRYFLNTPQEDIERHFRLGLRMTPSDSLQWYLSKLDSVDVTQVTLCARDRPGLFSRMVGVFTLNNMQVLSARIATLKNGLAFDIYRVTNPVDPYRETEVWKKAYEEALEAITGGDEIDARIEKRLLRRLESPRMHADWIRKVRIDNDVSDFFTCIEVSAGKRFGLLFRLAKEVFALDLNIRFATVYTDQEKTTGVFHVRDTRGQKIHDEVRIRVIRETILDVIS